LYGTETDDSDKDYLGVFIPDKDYVLGTKRVEQVEIRTNPTDSGHRNTKTDVDTVLYSLPKFIHLLTNNNPNILEVLFAPQKNIIYCDRFGQMLLDNANLFVSKKLKYTFLGYAISQKKKLLFKNFEGGRKEVVEKNGYETKFASHIIRLLSEGIELLLSSRVNFPLEIADQIRSIKQGKQDLNYVLTYADRLEQLVEQVFSKSTIPNTPDIEAINKLQISMLELFWKIQKNASLL